MALIKKIEILLNPQTKGTFICLLTRRLKTYEMTAVLRTDNSALIVHDLEPEICALVQECAEIVDSQLDVKPEIRVFGKICHQQRNVGFFSDKSKGYNYSTTITPSKKMHPRMLELLSYINNKFEYDYNGILVNKYVGGEDYIGKHSDDETGLDYRVGVVAISCGAVRKFRIRNKEDNAIVADILTEPNKIIQMAGNFQREFTHEIPVEKRVKDVRYSFTFRRHLQ